MTTDRLLATIVAVVAIVGLVVLLALGKIDEAAGLGLIGTLAGVHGGFALGTHSASSRVLAQRRVDRPH